MQQINDQIQQRLEEKQLQEEMKEQERQQTRKNQERMNLEDLQVSNQNPQPSTTWMTEWISEDLCFLLFLQALQRRREEQQRLLEEVLQINAEAVQAKDQRKEEEKLADIRDMEFLRKKQVTPRTRRQKQMNRLYCLDYGRCNQRNLCRSGRPNMKPSSVGSKGRRSWR